MKVKLPNGRRCTAHALLTGLLLAGFCWIGNSTVQAEVPPRSQENLVQEADLIVTGTVRSVRTTLSRDNQGQTFRNYHLMVKINTVTKGSHIGKTVLAHGYLVIKRPEGFAGASGHYTTDDDQRLSVLKRGSQVRLYLEKSLKRGYKIVLPNGFEPLN